MKKVIIIVALAAMACVTARAGLVITKAGKVTFGDVAETKEKLVVTIQIGKSTGTINYKRDVVFWHTTDKRVTNYYLGAVDAYNKKAYSAAKFLANLAVKNQPKFKAKAEELIGYIDNLNKIPDPIEETKKEITGEE